MLTPDTFLLTDHDAYLFREGTHARLYDRLGCHLREGGAHFGVWAPNARRVSVIGEFNGWRPDEHRLAPRSDGSGIWEIDVAGVARGQAYKYRVESNYGDYWVDKADPFAFYAEVPPGRRRAPGRSTTNGATAPGWRAPRAERARRADVDLRSAPRLVAPRRRNGSCLSYRELAHAARRLRHVDLGFTHVELLPVMEHPFYGSWGYQMTGYFAPTSRYGTPQDFMYLDRRLHQHGIGVILDWVPSHFPGDDHGLAYFDGTHLYEHADPRQGFHPDWNELHLQLRPARGARIPPVAAPCSGSTSTTSTACASMRSRRCSTSTTRARKASGSRTSTAAARISTPIDFLRAA